MMSRPVMTMMMMLMMVMTMVMMYMMGIVTFSVQQEEGLATSRSLGASFLIYPSFCWTSANMNQFCTQFVTILNASDEIYTQNFPPQLSRRHSSVKSMSRGE